MTIEEAQEIVTAYRSAKSVGVFAEARSLSVSEAVDLYVAAFRFVNKTIRHRNPTKRADGVPAWYKQISLQLSFEAIRLLNQASRDLNQNRGVVLSELIISELGESNQGKQ